jgi:hypothetical protein
MGFRKGYKKLLKKLVKKRKLKPIERLANRVGYMGTAFLIMSPHLIEYGGIGATTYIIGALCTLPQVWVAKQWNLVVTTINIAIGYIIFLI